MVILAVVLCVNLAACSDDDDEAGADTSLIGTTWRITASNEDKEMIGVTFTFNKDNSVTTNPVIWSKVTYSLSDSNLNIYFQDDDYITGTISINGNTASYKYHWADVQGEWSNDDEVYTMTLTKQ